MRWTTVLSFAAPLVALVIAGGPATPDELSRVRRHLRGAEAVLAKRDLSRLSPDQRANRQVVVELLRQYRRAGEFPRNEDFPDRRVPYFRDRHGNLCAMAFLLEQTGFGSIVEHVARTRNNGYVPELADEPGLAGWLDRFGIGLAEAARIQPEYGGSHEPGKLTTAYAMASVIGIGLSATGSGLNLTGPRSQQRAAWLAAGAGFVTAMLGVSKVDNGGEVQKVAIVNVVVGGLSALIGVSGLVDRGHQEAADHTGNKGPLTIGMTVGPGGAPGLAVRLRF